MAEMLFLSRNFVFLKINCHGTGFFNLFTRVFLLFLEMLKLTGMQLLIIVLFSKNIVYIMLAYEMFTHILINFLKSYYLLEYDINW